MSKHIFQIAYFNAFEKNLPDNVDLERMTASENFKKALSVLQDTNYADFVSQETPLSFEEILEKEEIDFRKNLAKIGLSKEVIDFLFLKTDLFNLGLILKQEIFGFNFSLEKDFIGTPLLKTSTLKEKYSFLIKEIKKDKIKDPMEVDERLNSFYFQEAIKISVKLKEKELKKFFTDYLKALKKRDEKSMESLEKDFLERNKWETQGLAPVFSFFLKRKIAQKKLKIILSGKQIGLDVKKISKLMENLIALI